MASKTENRSINLYLNSKSAGGSVKQMQSEFRRLNAETRKLDRNSKQYNENVKRLSKLRGDISNHNRAIRGVESRWTKLTGVVRKFAPFAAGAVAGATVMRAIRGAITTIKDYQDANANLAAVLGVTTQETEKLREQQIALGSSTAFTAAQAADAQTELAKLGFTLNEITSLTPAVLSLAAASGTDLPNAASIAGSTLRQFGLDATETDRVVDVMAKSFSASALDIAKFQVAMAQAGPVANAVGVDLEKATSLIGTLVNQGLDSSTAGTSLRNVFLDLKKAGLTFNEAMEQIRNSTDQASTAFDLFGKRGATTGVILANNAEGAAELETQLRNAGGAAKQMAEQQLDTLSGDLTKLNSAWEGFILTLENGEGQLAKTARSLFQISTGVISSLQAIERTGSSSGFGILDLLNPFSGGTAEKLQKVGLVSYIDNVNTAMSNLEQKGDMQGLQKIEEALQAGVDAAKEGSLGFNLYTEALEKNEAAQKAISDRAASEAFASLDRFKTGDDATAGTTPGLEDPKVRSTRTTMEQIKTITATMGSEINKIEQEIAERGLAIRKTALWDWEQMQNDVAQGDKQRAMEKLQNAQMVANGVGQSLMQISTVAGASAEHQQEIGAFMNTVNSGIALGQAISSVKSSDPLTYLALLGAVVSVITSLTAQAQDTTNAAQVPAPPAFATGVDSAPGGMALVGETGPELLNIPEGSSVTPSGPSRNLIFGSNPQLDFDSVPDLSNGGGNALISEMRAMRSEISNWQSKLRVENVQTDFDEYSERYQANRKRVRNVRA